MRVVDGHIRLEATDLVHHLACPHVTTLEVRGAEGGEGRPSRDDPGARGLPPRGRDHTAAYLAVLRARGLRVVHLDPVGADAGATLAAMRGGADAIASARLEGRLWEAAPGTWEGCADVLLRVDGPGAASDLGEYHYEVVDTTQAMPTRAGTVLQLCLLNDLLGRLQGRHPDRVLVILPGTCFEPLVYRVEPLAPYYRQARRRLESSVVRLRRASAPCQASVPEAGFRGTGPPPCDHCRLCHFAATCQPTVGASGRPALVAGATRLQARVEGSGRGLDVLPEPSQGDVFLQLESAAHAGGGPGGLEYLWGWSTLTPMGRPLYHHLWANDSRHERRAFEQVVDQITVLRDLYPHMHVYHWQFHEPAALQRLAGRHATREAEVDILLQAGVFVDVSRAMHQASPAAATAAGEPSGKPGVAGDDAGAAPPAVGGRSKALLEALLETGRGEAASVAVRDTVRDDNRDRCESMWGLYRRLRPSRVEASRSARGVPAPTSRWRPPDRPPRVERLRGSLTHGLSPRHDERDEAQQARWLLAHLLDWHWHEAWAAWWERCRGASEKEGCLDGPVAGAATASRILDESLMRLARWALARGLDTGGSDSPRRAGRDLLLGRPPRRRSGTAPGLRAEGEDGLTAARRLALELDGGCLPIQTPPGSGGMRLAAEVIVALARVGRRVGVTAARPASLETLLAQVATTASAQGVDLVCRDLAEAATGAANGGIARSGADDQSPHSLRLAEVPVLGAVASEWARAAHEAAVDTLVAIGAGQMSLATVMALSAAARNLVLLGDPQQEELRLQGGHPEGTEVSALRHVLGRGDVMPPHRGLFLEETRRLPPTICRYTSRWFYEGKLTCAPGLERQVLAGPTRFAGAGLWLEPVAHQGNRQACPEEGRRVGDVVADLLQPGVTWTDAQGRTADLELGDVLVVSPFDEQVELLRQVLGPAARVHTVDQLHDQEAVVVVYSLTSSRGQDAPGGIASLCSLQRLNRVTSRARCAGVLVASPLLFPAACRTVGQMRMASALCAAVQQAAFDVQPELETTAGTGETAGPSPRCGRGAERGAAPLAVSLSGE